MTGKGRRQKETAATYEAAEIALTKLLRQVDEDQHPKTAITVHQAISMGWLYALHARSSTARGRALLALYMINGIREQVVTLACLRYGLPPDQGRGVDDLPEDIKQVLADTVPHALDQTELNRSFTGVTAALLAEAIHVDTRQASRLEAPLRELVRTAAGLPPETPLPPP